MAGKIKSDAEAHPEKNTIKSNVPVRICYRKASTLSAFKAYQMKYVMLPANIQDIARREEQ